MTVSLQTPLQAKTRFYHFLIPLSCKKGEVRNVLQKISETKSNNSDAAFLHNFQGTQIPLSPT